jgi:hypothetical protein
MISAAVAADCFFLIIFFYIIFIFLIVEALYNFIYIIIKLRNFKFKVEKNFFRNYSICYYNVIDFYD